MDIIEISFDNTGFVYDSAEPTKQTEELSYMLKNALNGQTLRLIVNSETELTDRDTLVQAVVDLVTNGQDNGETGEFSPPLNGFVSGIYSAITAIWEQLQISSSLAGLYNAFQRAFLRKNEAGDIIGSFPEDSIDAIQDVAAASGVVLDAYGDIIAVQRITPEELP